MVTFFSVVHVLLCVFMIFVILLQPGKDAGMGAALGGGAATSAFGGRGAVTFLSKLTAACATAFFLTSLGLSFVGVRASAAKGLVVETKPAPVQAPAVPGGAAVPEAQKTTGADAPGKAEPTAGAATGTEAVPAEKLPPQTP